MNACSAPERDAVPLSANIEAVGHIAQDLRAEAHRVPDDVAKLMRQAAVVCDAYSALRVAVDDLLDADTGPAPVPPPESEPCA